MGNPLSRNELRKIYKLWLTRKGFKYGMLFGVILSIILLIAKIPIKILLQPSSYLIIGGTILFVALFFGFIGHVIMDIVALNTSDSTISKTVMKAIFGGKKTPYQ